MGIPKVVTIAPPIQIFHPFFQQFLDATNDRAKLQLDEEGVAEVSHTMMLSSRIYSSEDAEPWEIRRSLDELLGGQMDRVIPNTSHNAMFKRQGNRNIPLILREYRRGVGKGGCDPSVQAARSLREFLIKSEACAFCAFSVTPSSF
jgi:hypothetical protein